MPALAMSTVPALRFRGVEGDRDCWCATFSSTLSAKVLPLLIDDPSVVMRPAKDGAGR
jgi:hypothetical protein